MARSSKVVGGRAEGHPALGLLGLLLASIAIQLAAQTATHGKPIVSAYHRSDEGPGKMQLLPGYVAGLPEGQTCIDSDCGYIWNPQGLTINYDIGGMAGVSVGPNPPDKSGEYYFWYGEASINGQPVRYAVSGSDRPASVSVSFPDSTANFNAEIRSEREIKTVLQMVLTYQGVGYRVQSAGTVDGLVTKPDRTPLEGIEVTLDHPSEAKTARTDAQGHFRFPSVSPGRYNLIARRASQDDCKFPPQHWRIKTDPAQIHLRSFTIRCR
jgi:hypothetical protein